MLADFVFQKSIIINAIPAAVWDVLVNPNNIKQYLFGTETISAWKEGSPIAFTGTYDGKEYRDGGTILKFIPEKVFRYSYWSGFSGLPDLPENYSFIQFELFPECDGTLLTFTQERFASREAYEHAKLNWDSVVAKIKDLAEKSGLPPNNQ